MFVFCGIVQRRRRLSLLRVPVRLAVLAARFARQRQLGEATDTSRAETEQHRDSVVGYWCGRTSAVSRHTLGTSRCTSDHGTDSTGAASAVLDWSAILTSHDHWLRTVVYWRLQDREAVDDVMQEVALAAVKQSAPIADVARVGPWLYRLAVRYVLLYRRSRGRQRRLLHGYELRGGAGDRPGEPEPLEWLLSGERRQMVRHALQKLPDRDAEILLLKYTENWSYHQIAEHLGVSHSAVEARLHRARARLRSELSGTISTEVRS